MIRGGQTVPGWRLPLPRPGTALWLPLLALAILGLALLPDRYPAGGFLWDWLNGLGFAALAVIVFLGWDSRSPARQPRLRLHSHIATLGCVLVVAHAVGFLIADPLLLEYVKPKAPASMLAGLVAALAMVAVTVTSYPGYRLRCYRTFARFRWWHRLAAIGLLGLSLWHIVGAGYSVGPGPGSDRTWLVRLALLVPLAALAPLIAFHRRRNGRTVPVGPAPADSAAADRHTAIVAVGLMLLSVVWAVLKNA